MALKKIHQQRLLKLAKFLREKIAKHESVDLYDQSFYIGKDKNGHHHARASLECGTPACALGWATAVFPLRKNRYGDIVEIGKRNSSTIATVINFFGINDNGDQDRLFFTTTDRTAVREAEIIEDFVRNNS